MGIKSAIYGGLLLGLIAFGLQLAACLTNGWLIISGDKFADDNPWFKDRSTNRTSGAVQAGRIHSGIWYLEICIENKKCEKIYDYRTEPGKQVRYFEGLPDELQALSVLGIAFVGFAILTFRPLFKTISSETINCWGINICVLSFFSGIASLSLAFVALDKFGAIQRVFDHGGYEEISSEVPYSLILSGAGTAVALVAALVMAIVCCKLHQASVLRDMMEQQLIAEERQKEELVRAHHIPDRKTYNGGAKKPVQIKNQEQVVYSIHL